MGIPFRRDSVSCAAMDAAEISRRLEPFVSPSQLSAEQLNHISIYIDILKRWNRKINLTSVRQPEEMVTRHFGESLFAARHLLADLQPDRKRRRVVDVGSGAGFPGLPMKIYAPEVHLTLIESNHRKAAFLREVIRRLQLGKVDVFAGRAQDFPGKADLVTMRAVEKFEQALDAAAALLAPRGRLALLIGAGQLEAARHAHSGLVWEPVLPIPGARERVLAVGWNQVGHESGS